MNSHLINEAGERVDRRGTHDAVIVRGGTAVGANDVHPKLHSEDLPVSDNNIFSYRTGKYLAVANMSKG